MQREVKPQAAIRSVRGSDSTAMEKDGMLDDGKAEPCASSLAGTPFVHTIKSLEEPRELVGLDPLAVVFKSYVAVLLIVSEQRDVDVLAL